MPYAVAHVLSAGIAADLIRAYVIKKKHRGFITLNTVLIAAVAALIPDIDVVFSGILRFFGTSFSWLNHGGVTHTLFFGLIFIIPGIILWKKEKHKLAGYFFAVAFGICFHILMDFVLGGGSSSGIMLFWPITSMKFTQLFLLSKIGLSFASLDAVLLITWLIYEIKTKRLREFI